MQSFLFFLSLNQTDVFGVQRKLLAKLDLEDFDLILRKKRLRWFGHEEHSSGLVRTAYDIQIDAR